MKVFIFAFLALAVGASAFPQEYELENRAEQRNVVEREIRKWIEAVGEFIKANNLDPFQINRLRIETSPVPGIDIDLLIEDLTLLGASNIQIERLIWNNIGSRLRLTVVLPRIFFFNRRSSLGLNIHGDKYEAEGSGEFIMERLTVSFDVHLNIGITGISVRSVIATIRIGRIWCDANLILNGEDISNRVNTLINDTIPKWIDRNQNTIDLVLSEVVKRIANLILDSR